MDTWKHMKRQNLKWGNFLLDSGGPYRWKDEGELFEMAWSSSKESDGCTGEKEWADSSWGNGK